MIIGICGRSGSGKSTLAKRIRDEFGRDKVIIVDQDSYYKDLSHMSMSDRKKVNFDHPETIDIDLFTEHLDSLKSNQTISKPIYDFKTHTREERNESVLPKKIILVEGIHVFYKKGLRDLMEIKVFVDVPKDICFIRRLLRDTKERGRSVECVINQYIETVRPMQEKYVSPTIRYADFVFKGGGDNLREFQLLSESIKEKILVSE